LPDRIERALAKQPRHDGVLDIAVAAQALQAFNDMGRSSFAYPILGYGCGDTAEDVFVNIRLGCVVRPCSAHCERCSCLRRDGLMSENVLHERLLAELSSERRSMAGMMKRLHERLTH